MTQCMLGDVSTRRHVSGYLSECVEAARKRLLMAVVVVVGWFVVESAGCESVCVLMCAIHRR